MVAISIIFSNPKTIYYAGQLLSGTVVLSLQKPLKLQSIELKITGKAVVSFEETFSDSDGGRSTLYASQVYIEHKILLYSSPFVTGDVILPVGEYNYPFSLILPNNLPSSIQCDNGSINYAAQVKITIPWAINKQETGNFTVRHLTTLDDPSLNSPVKVERSKKFCCLCCASGPLTLLVHVPRSGLTPRAPTPITIEVDNASNVVVSALWVHIQQMIRCKAEGESRSQKVTILSLKLDQIEAHNSKTYCQSLTLPDDHYPNLDDCSIIDVSYNLLVKADAAGAHTDLDITIPIRIGDVIQNNCDLPPSYETAVLENPSHHNKPTVYVIDA